METQSPSHDPKQLKGQHEISVGTTVIYGRNGKCRVSGVEIRMIGGAPVKLYKLEVQKSPLSRSSKHEPAIWVPVASAAQQGLRLPMDGPQAEAALEVLSSREYYFDPKTPWNNQSTLLEKTINVEGGVGMAKVLSFLHVLKRKQVLLGTDANRLLEHVHRQLLREISEALHEPMTNIEDRITKGLRHKLIPDT